MAPSNYMARKLFLLLFTNSGINVVIFRAVSLASSRRSNLLETATELFQCDQCHTFSKVTDEPECP